MPCLDSDVLRCELKRGPVGRLETIEYGWEQLDWEAGQ